MPRLNYNNSRRKDCDNGNIYVSNTVHLINRPRLQLLSYRDETCRQQAQQGGDELEEAREHVASPPFGVVSTVVPLLVGRDAPLCTAFGLRFAGRGLLFYVGVRPVWTGWSLVPCRDGLEIGVRTACSAARAAASSGVSSLAAAPARNRSSLPWKVRAAAMT